MGLNSDNTEDLNGAVVDPEIIDAMSVVSGANVANKPITVTQPVGPNPIGVPDEVIERVMNPSSEIEVISDKTSRLVKMRDVSNQLEGTTNIGAEEAKYLDELFGGVYTERICKEMFWEHTAPSLTAHAKQSVRLSLSKEESDLSSSLELFVTYMDPAIDFFTGASGAYTDNLEALAHTANMVVSNFKAASATKDTLVPYDGGSADIYRMDLGVIDLSKVGGSETLQKTVHGIWVKIKPLIDLYRDSKHRAHAEGFIHGVNEGLDYKQAIEEAHALSHEGHPLTLEDIFKFFEACEARHIFDQIRTCAKECHDALISIKETFLADKDGVKAAKAYLEIMPCFKASVKVICGVGVSANTVVEFAELERALA